MKNRILSISWFHILIFCATLGLAPFQPPHIWEKLNMIFTGQALKPIDIFDFFFHGIPWMLLMLKSYFWVANKTILHKQKTP